MVCRGFQLPWDLLQNSPLLLCRWLSRCFEIFFWFGIHTASVPSTAETHTGGGAVLGKSEGSPARRHSRKKYYLYGLFDDCSFEVDIRIRIPTNTR